jgi:hypothetical protein
MTALECFDFELSEHDDICRRRWLVQGYLRCRLVVLRKIAVRVQQTHILIGPILRGSLARAHSYAVA